MSKVEILKNGAFTAFDSPASSRHSGSNKRTKIISSGFQQIKQWKNQAMGDPTFDPPMPDATIPTNMQGFPNKNLGWMHTYMVTTDPGMAPAVTFPNAPPHLIPDVEIEEITPQNYKVNVTVGTTENPGSGSLVMEFSDQPSGLKDKDPVQPKEYKIISFPNPFNSQTQIEYSLPGSSDVEINVYNIKGELVQQIFKGNQPSGNYRVHWDGKDSDGKVVTTGVYLLQLRTPVQQKTFKMMMLK